MCSGIRGRKEAPHCSLARALLSLSPPLRADRSFDSGSKFTLQTCWEAEERCHGTAFLHFKDPERLPDRLSEILRLIINLCSCETSAAAPGSRRGPKETRLREGIGGLTFIESDCSNSGNSSARHTYSQK